MKKILLILTIILVLSGCTPSPDPAEPPTSPATQPVTDPATQAPTDPPDPIVEQIGSMTAAEKVGQLFLARYNGSNAVQHTTQLHLGGWILFAQDFENESPDSILEELAALQAVSNIPLLIAVDEEGGTVTRVSRFSAFRDSKFPSPRSLYKKGGTELVLETEAEKADLLSSIGVNVNLAPVCDITTNKDAFMYSRSLGLSPEETGAVIAGMVQTAADHGVAACLKHFPGYANNVDTHVGIAVDHRSLESLEAADLVPFRAGIGAGCDAILVSHTIVTALDDTLPASLSPVVLDYLREEMGFHGVAMTDDLVMEAITDTYGAGEAAVLAVLAGNDLLCSTEYVTQYEAVLAAVQDGRISMERIEEAVYRVLTWKVKLGLLSF